MMQIPNLPNYSQVPQQPSYNAVKIDVHNPMVNVPAQAPQYYPQQQNAPQYEVPTMPYYNYPQAQTQPYYMPPVINTPETVQQQAPVLVPPTVSQPAPVAQEVPVQPEVVPPAPVVAEVPVADEKKSEAPATEVKTEAPVSADSTVEVVPSQEVAPQVDINEFIAKLTSDDYDVQEAAMEEIADMVDKDPKKATDLLESKIIDALNNIITADTSSLEKPTDAQNAAREKLFSNQEMTEEEKTLANTVTPYDKAERNKSYAMFTTAILQKLYGEEYAKLSGGTVPLTELPGAVTVVQQLKSNPNPTVRASAIEALSYIQEPSYKKDLNTIFTIAQQDQDPRVQDVATAALAKLNEVADMPEAPAQAA